MAYQKNGWPLLLLLRSNAAASQPPTFIVVHIQEKEEEEKVPTEIYAACISMFGSLGRERERNSSMALFLFIHVSYEKGSSFLSPSFLLSILYSFLYTSMFI